MLWRITRTLVFGIVTAVGLTALNAGNLRVAVAAAVIGAVLLGAALWRAARAFGRFRRRRSLEELHGSRRGQTPYR